jgi:hypothetical protein
MPKFNNIYSVIVQAQSPIFSAHTYSEIYGGSAGCSVVVNGTNVSVGAASTVSILVRSISGGTGCFLLGDNNNVYLGSSVVDSYGDTDVR